MGQKKNIFKGIVLLLCLIVGSFSAPQKVLHAYRLGLQNHGNSAILPVQDMLNSLKGQHGFTVTDVDGDQMGLLDVDQYDLVIFNNVSENAFTDQSVRNAVRNYMEGGGVAIGYHASIDHHDYWDWWKDNMHSGSKFTSHLNNPFLLDLDSEIDQKPALKAMWEDLNLGNIASISNTEIYVLNEGVRGKPGVTMLQTVNENNTPDPDHPFTWVKDVGQGEYFFTCLGHSSQDFQGGFLEEMTWGAMKYLTGDYDVISGCMDSTAENYSDSATVACTDCCTYAACCGTEGYVEYDPNCQNPQETECLTVGISQIPLNSVALQISSDRFTINFANPYEINLVNLNGEIVIGETNRGKNEYRYSEIEAGIYFLKVKSGSNTLVRRLMIQ